MMEENCGAKDIGAFRAMMSGGASGGGAAYKGLPAYLPLASSIEYEGIYNEFYFDIGRESEKLFAPKYSYCKSEDPFSHKSEHYLVVGLASKYDGDGIVTHGRNPFNLVIAIDISGSMSGKLGSSDDQRTKMEITASSVISIISLLKPGDRFGCVTFNDDVKVVQDLELIENIKIPELKKSILGLKPEGGTALSAALKRSTRLFDEVKKDSANYKKYENSIFVMTDLVPTKDASTTTFINTVRKNASERLYTSIIGIGAEFSSDILKQLGKIRACNYFTVFNPQDFKRIIDSDFVYVLSPIAFNITLSIHSDQFAVERVYGSPGNEIPKEGEREMMRIECVSPSAVDEKKKIKGGIVLAKLKEIGGESGGALKCRLQFEDRNGEIHVDEQEVSVPVTSEKNYFEGEAGRKSVLLTRYVNITKHWILDETTRKLKSDEEDICDSPSPSPLSPSYSPSVTKETGIIPPPIQQENSAKKRIPYFVTPHYVSLVKDFIDHFNSETAEIKDNSLESYVLALKKISESAPCDCKDAKQASSRVHLNCLDSFFTPDFQIEKAYVDKLLQDIAKNGKWSLMQKLDNQLDDAKPESFLSAIQVACDKGHPKILKRLLEKGSKQKKFTKEQLEKPMESAIKRGFFEIILILLSEISESDWNKNLKLAYEYGKSKCARFFIDKGGKGISVEDIQRDLTPAKNQKSGSTNELDLVFCCDCTGSMGSYLKSAQDSILQIVNAITEKAECDIRFGLVKYRDHQDDFASETHEFTFETKRMKAYVDTMAAAGGGDIPECLVDGMEESLNMDWRPNATKIVCIVTDAPPHGLTPHGDDHPAGCPCGYDPLDVARKMASKSIVLYSLGVNTKGIVKYFLTAISLLTEGKFVELENASVLADVIVGGSIEELDLRKITQKVKDELEGLKSLALDEDDTLLQLTESLQKQNIRVKQMTISNEGQDNSSVNILMGASNLEEALKQIGAVGANSTNENTGKTTFVVEEKLISMKQVARIWNRLNFHSN